MIQQQTILVDPGHNVYVTSVESANYLWLAAGGAWAFSGPVAPENSSAGFSRVVMSFTVTRAPSIGLSDSSPSSPQESRGMPFKDRISANDGATV